MQGLKGRLKETENRQESQKDKPKNLERKIINLFLSILFTKNKFNLIHKLINFKRMIFFENRNQFEAKN